MKNIVVLKVVIMALLLNGCSSVTKQTAAIDEDLLFYSYNPDDILREIDEKWEALGYAEKPTKYIAISFDDGPAGNARAVGMRTQDVLDVLAEKRVKATFFLIGQNVRTYPDAVQAILDTGHEVGNHSDDGAGLGARAGGSLDGIDVQTIRSKLDAASAAIKDVAGKSPFFFRAPNVDYGINLATVCKTLGMPLIGANVWSNDWDASRTADECMVSVINSASDGGIINFHEPNTSGNRTLPVLADIIEALRSDGYWILSVGQLAALKGKELEAGVRYDSL
ncbi:MAG: polysaccharide deacetylase family protein [Treponema sp.]|jgi:peptidoglycan/xylan/chitin deacetylase (PgdA/CDA1 family)|nr:polysaccharide deacetylase family protein [Treponema sp.]